MVSEETEARALSVERTEEIAGSGWEWSGERMSASWQTAVGAEGEYVVGGLGGLGMLPLTGTSLARRWDRGVCLDDEKSRNWSKWLQCSTISGECID